jgi:hypothetical protein
MLQNRAKTAYDLFNKFNDNYLQSVPSTVEIDAFLSERRKLERLAMVILESEELFTLSIDNNKESKFKLDLRNQKILVRFINDDFDLESDL